MHLTFIQACESGDIESVKTTYDKNLCQKGFYAACAFGNLDIAQYLYENAEIKLKLQDAFHKAYRNHHITISIWLFMIINPQNAQLRNIFDEVCRIGFIDMAKWLYDTKKVCMTKLYDTNYGIEIIKWNCNLKKHSYNEICEALISSCFHGDLTSAQWFFSLNKFSPNVTNGIFIKACHKTHFKIAKWIYPYCKISKNDMQIAFELLCTTGHVEFVKWFYELNICVITEEIFLSSCYNEQNLYGGNYYKIKCRGQCAHKHINVARWLYTFIDLTWDTKISLFKSMCLHDDHIKMAKDIVDDCPDVLLHCIFDLNNTCLAHFGIPTNLPKKIRNRECIELNNFMMDVICYHNLTKVLYKICNQRQDIKYDVVNGRISYCYIVELTDISSDQKN